MRLTIAVPFVHIDIANHYAMALGYSEADGLTYRNPSWEDADGNLYAVASLPVSEVFVGAATSPLVRPEWDGGEVIDITKATQAQGLVALWSVSDETDPPQAAPDQITAILGMGGVEAIETMGLTAAAQDEELP